MIMKQIVLAYVLVTLVLVALLSVFSYGYGAGYVYLYWRDWQLQTNIWVLLILLMLISLVVQLIWAMLKRYLSREQRKQAAVFDFQHLHPYEQMAVIWLLDAAREQDGFIRQVFNQSGLLKAVIHSRLSLMQQDYPVALQMLNQSNAMAFELAELQRIEIYLAQQQPEKALTHLEFLNGHQLSPWLKDVKQAYEQRLTALWGEFALQYPWLYLRATQYGHLGLDSKQLWLEQILQHFEQATPEALQDLKQRYCNLSGQMFSQPYAIKVLWLKVLARLNDMGEQQEHLAVHLLSEQFHQDVFYLWFQQQLLKPAPDYLKIEDYLNQWEQQYPALPVLSFAKWHIFEATGRHDDAAQLLDLYPEHILMNYLRIKSALKDQPHLQQQLNLVFENNSHFMKIKI